jgi:DeoD family purine-nucleoside phosphorylase
MSDPVSTETIHLRPHEDVAERVLLPGDPGRALRLAQQLIDGPRMLNHNRGLWGYSGMAHDGAPLTVQSTGMGGPSAAIVIEELVRLGARRLLRVGTCGALADLELGTLLVAEAALGEDGASRALGATAALPSDPGLLAALRAAAPDVPAGLIVSADLFYDPDESSSDRRRAAGALAVEMEAATLFAIAARHELPAACIVAVSDIVATGERIGAGELLAAEAELGRVALAALAG